MADWKEIRTLSKRDMLKRVARRCPNAAGSCMP